VILGGDTSPEFRAVQPEVQLRSIARINARLCTSMDVEEVLPQVLDLLFEAFPSAINGHILLLDQDGQLRPRALKKGRDADSSVFTRVPVDDSVARHVMQTGAIAVQETPKTDWVVGDDEPSKLTAPIVGPSQEPLGVIHLEMHSQERAISPTEIELMAAVGHATGQAVELARAHQRLLEVDRSQQQMIIARQVQMRMLPQTGPDVDGYAIASHYSPAAEVGGDFFSYFRLTNGGVAIALGDVCGKGVPAALLMAELISEVRHAITTAETVKQAMRHINRVAFERELRFVTLTLCVLDPLQHSLGVANAGHLPPLCRRHRTGSVEQFQPKRSGLPLAVVKDQEFHPETFYLDPGDAVLLFTDGMSEAMNQTGTLYGMSRTQSAFQQASGGPDQMLQTLMHRVETYCGGLPPTDDVCLVCFQRLPGLGTG
jgi:serine phosphatase RsbU (regulator of sigma subunit)